MMFTKRIRPLPVSFLLICLVTVMLLAGCSKVTQQNYDKLKVGMSYEEVVIIIGEAAQCDSAMGAKSCTWGKADKTIDAKFIADKLLIFTAKGL